MRKMSVLLLDTEPKTKNHYITLCIRDAFLQHPQIERVVLADNGNALSLLFEQKLDTFVAIGSAGTNLPILARLAHSASLSVLWTTEDPYERASNVRHSTCFDVVFTNDLSSVPAYGGRAHFLPLGADPRFQQQSVLRNDRDYLYDLLFIGTAWPNRVRSLNKIFDHFAGKLKAKVALPSNAFLGRPRLNDPGILVDWRCGNEDFARLANRSRVVLTLPRIFSASSEHQEAGSTPPPRLYEVALAGGAQAVLSFDEEIRSYYDDPSEIRICDGEASLLFAIEDMLSAPEQRIEMAIAAQQRTLAQHLFAHRVDRLVKIATADTVRQRPTPSARKRVLVVAHNRVQHRPGGGVELYQELLSNLLTGFDFIYFYPRVQEQSWAIRVEGPGFREDHECVGFERSPLIDAGIEQIFEETLFRHKIDLVHFQHLLHLPLSLPLLAKSYGVPTIYHLHDFHIICHRFNLLNFEGRFCDVVNRGDHQCDNCLLAAENLPPGSKTRRDSFISEAIRCIDVFVASTPYSRDYVERFFPESRGKIQVIEMVVPGSEASPPPVRQEEHKGGLQVAVPGNFTFEKGGRYILDVIRSAEDLDVQFHILGRVQPEFRDRLSGLNQRHVHLTGGYRQADVLSILSRFDVSLHLSIWPETFLIALSEAWQAGLVPIVTALGAPGERVKDGHDGFVVPPHDPGAVLHCLKRLLFDPGLIRQMQAQVANRTPMTGARHAEALRALYDAQMDARPCLHERVSDRVPNAFNLTAFDVGVRVNSPRWDSRDNIWDQAIARLGSEIESPTRLLDRLPAEATSLPVEILDPHDPDLRLEIDSFQVDGTAVSMDVVDRVATDTILVRGWILCIRQKEPVRTFLRLRSGDLIRIAEVQVDSRPDLAALPSFLPAANAGFLAVLDVTTLPPGRYRVDALQVAGDRLLVVEDLLSFVAAGDASPVRRPLSIWHAGLASLVDTRSEGPSGGSIRVLESTLRLLGGGMLGQPDQVWCMTAEISSGDRPRDSRFAAVLCREAPGPSYWTTVRSDQPFAAGAAVAGSGYARLSLRTRLSGIEPGVYRLMLAHVYDRRLSWIESGSQVFVPPPGFSFLWTDVAPEALARKRVKSTDPRLTIDNVEPTGRLGFAAVDLVRVRGWSYAKDLGDPVCWIFSWSVAGQSTFCITEGQRRADVLKHIKGPRALVCGFDVCVPDAALSHGSLRLFQVCEKGTVEFFDLAEKLEQADHGSRSRRLNIFGRIRLLLQQSA